MPRGTKTAILLAVSGLLGLAVVTLAGRRERSSSAGERPSAPVASASPLLAAAPMTETAALKSQLTDRQLTIEVRVAAALRLKALADGGQTDLVGAVLDGAELDHADLYGANLSNASLVRAKLRGAILFSATLRNADLSDAELADADLRGVDCIGANLQRADLSHAVLYGTDLSDAQLEGAKLYGARLNGANLTTSKLVGADLRGAFYNGIRSGYPTRFAKSFDPREHGMLECPGALECER